MASVDGGEARTATTDKFVTALVFNLAVAGAEIAAFALLRPYFPAVYQPRTYVPPKSNRIGSLVSGKLVKQFLWWPIAVWNADYRAIKKANGLDSYFFVRFLRMMIKVMLPIWLISWAVLLPTTSVRTHVGKNEGLDNFIFGNVARDKTERYSAHIILAWIFTGWILYNLKSEMSHFIITRQKYLMDPARAGSVQANTLLVTGIPAKYLNPTALRKTFDQLPGGVTKIWINRDLKTLPDVYDRQMSALGKLESAETKLLKMRIKAKETKAKKGKDVEVQRPTHKLGFLGLWGEKVDTIDWCTKEIAETKEILDQGRSDVLAQTESDPGALNPNEDTNDAIDEQDEDLGHEIKGATKGVVTGLGKGAKAVAGTARNMVPIGGKGGPENEYPPLNSAFIQFNKQIAAHLASQALAHHEPYRMSNRYIEMSPKDVIWSNLSLNPYEMKVRLAISWAITLGLIIFWSFPVAFVGAISNVNSLCSTYSWLAWLCDLPTVVVGIIGGILPPVLLAILNMLLPIVLRLLARFEGIPKYSGCELSLMNRFFIFQVFHGFLIVTLSSGIIASLEELSKNLTSIPSILAQNLPTASTFFLTYVILQGLAGTAGGFLQIVGLIIYYAKLYILGSTPRSVYGIKYSKRTVAWGTLFPSTMLLVVITIAYMIISPIINGLAVAALFLFYMLYKYLFLWVYDMSETTDTGGLFFPRAIQHTFVGLYIQQVCLCALFFLVTNESGGHSCIPHGALMVVLIVFTAGFHLILNNSNNPLISALPLSLADKMYTPKEISAQNTAATQNDNDLESNGGNTPTSNGATPPRESVEESMALNKKGEPLSPTQAEKRPQGHEEKQVSEEDEYGFQHPAASRPQRPIWIPSVGAYREGKDAIADKDGDEGWESEEVQKLQDAGLNVSTQCAGIDGAKGRVDVWGPPPGTRFWED